MNQYNFADLTNTTSAIPAKTRQSKKSPLYARMEKLSLTKPFVIEGAKMAGVAANVYATAKRLGIKVSLRQLAEGVGVWRVRNTAAATEVERKQEAGNGRRKGAVGRKTVVKGRKAA